jgi:lipoyl(octanoyl) transferase
MVVPDSVAGAGRPVEWRVEPQPVPYPVALAEMEARAAAVAAGDANELLWLLEHPPVVTAGTSAEAADLLDAARFPLAEAGRGGRHTYHGPGQRVVYAVLDLGSRGRDVRCYVRGLERWAIAALAELGVAARISSTGVGIWVPAADGGEAKIGAIGVRVRRWVALHGMAINVTTDLSAYDAIVPCGIADRAVARLVDLVPGAAMADLDGALRRNAASFLQGITKALEGEKVSG